MIYHAVNNPKKTVMVVLIYDKDFIKNTLTRDKDLYVYLLKDLYSEYKE